jgi:hypothetical protein
MERVLGVRGVLADATIKRIKQSMRPALRSRKAALPAEELKILERTVEDFLGLDRLAAPVYVATSFGYADIPLEKTFSAVFEALNVQSGAATQCVLRAVINEWLPIAMDGIPHGHRAICLFDFPQGVPGLIAELPKVNYPTPSGVDVKLYLCSLETWDLRKAEV